MTLKFFIMYIGAFLGLSIILTALIKPLSASFSNQGRKPFFFNIISSLIASAAAFGATYLSQDLFTVFWALSAVFLLFGIIFLLIVHKKYFNPEKGSRNKQLFAEILYAIAIVFLFVAMFSAMQFFIKDRNFMFFPMLLSGLFFFIPVLLLSTFDAAYSIPQPRYIAWTYPSQPIDLPDEQENERLYVIGFVISKKPDQLHATYFRAKAPEHMKLGDLYYHFINDYNEQFSETPIEYTTGEEAHLWLFRTRPKWYLFSRRLNPQKTVNDNRIKENTIIVCERAV